MSLGLCCQFLEPRTKRDLSIVYENSINEQSMQLGKYKEGAYPLHYIKSVYHNNVDEIIRVIPKLIQNNIKCFRLSSNLFPLWEFNNHIIKEDAVLIQKLNHCGHLFKSHNIRVTTHPGQFTVLSSDNPQVIQNSIVELDYHAWVFDQFNLSHSPYNAINIHGGKGDRSAKLIQSILALPHHIKSRLTLENDETCYNITDLLFIHKETGVPVCFDSHHHSFNNNGLSHHDAFHQALSTWKDTGAKPLQHISNTIPGQENGSYTARRKHSDYIHHIPLEQYTALVNDSIDLEVEAKMKNLAVIHLQQNLDAISLSTNTI